MTLPNWYALLLLSLASYRTWKLLAEDTILDPIRDRMGYGLQFVRCPWCLGFWVGLAWWGAFELWPHGTPIAAVPFVISVVVGVLGWAID